MPRNIPTISYEQYERIKHLERLSDRKVIKGNKQSDKLATFLSAYMKELRVRRH